MRKNGRIRLNTLDIPARFRLDTLMTQLNADFLLFSFVNLDGAAAYFCETSALLGGTDAQGIASCP